MLGKSISKPLVSVVIPLYNSEKWIKETLLSVYKQSYENIEIIIVNDGSTDRSIHLIQEIAPQNNTSLEIFSIKNSGVSYARNFGIQKSRGDLIALLDSDDVWDSEKLELQVSFLEEHPQSIAVLCDFYISKVNSRNGKLENKRVISKRGVNDIGRSWLSLEGNGALLSSTALIWKSSFIEKISFQQDLGTAADLCFYLKLAEIGAIGHISNPMVQYRQHSAQMHTNPDLLKKDFILLMDNIEHLPANLTKRKVLGNAHTLSSLVNFSNGDYRNAFQDLRIGFFLRPTSLIRIPISIIYKRLISFLTIRLIKKG
jgi:glycosyltransferase involved in cell wall biosynthesis